MTQNHMNKPVTMVFTWNKAIDTLKATIKPALPLILLSLFAPTMVAYIFLSSLSSPAANTLQFLAQSMQRFEIPRNFAPLLAETIAFLSTHLFLLLLLSLLFCATYIALVHLALLHQKGKKPPSKLLPFYWRCMKLTLPRGFLLFLGILIISIEQYILGPFRVLTMFALMAPILLIEETKGVMRSLWRAMSLKYVATSQSRFSVATVFISLGALLFLSENLVSFIVNSILYADEWLNIPRNLWTIPFPGLPMSFLALVLKLVELFCYIILILTLPCFTVSLYFLAKSAQEKHV